MHAIVRGSLVVSIVSLASVLQGENFMSVPRSNRLPSASEIGACTLIIAILSLILAPVFRAAEKNNEEKALVHLRICMTAVMMYIQDYDEGYPLTQYSPVGRAYDGEVDRVAQQLILPYFQEDKLLTDPADATPRSAREKMEVPYLPNTSARAAFNYALKSNWGYNYQYLGPLAANPDRTVTVFFAQLAAPWNTIYALDSVWNRTRNGKPYGGGTNIVDPPCVRLVDGTETRPPIAPSMGRYWIGGWNPGTPLAWGVYGGAWQWHQTGFVTAFADGHVSVKTLAELTAGCDVRNGWGGRITDREAYLWDLE
jgi:prepilin-type processing-associated H-X9-DG protein